MSNPLDFVTNFLKQPYPTMGLAPSVAITKTGGTVIAQGNGADGIGKTGETMWARIAAAVPFGWTLGGLGQAAKTVDKASNAVVAKINEGPAAVDGLVKSASSLVTSYVSYSKWIIAGVIAVAFIVFAAQVKTLVKS